MHGGFRIPMRLEIMGTPIRILFCLSLLVAAYVAGGQVTPSPVAVTIALEKNLITQNEPVLLRLTFENQSEREVVVSLGDDDEILEMSSEDSSSDSTKSLFFRLHVNFECGLVSRGW